MLTDARQLNNDSLIEGDICIVGAGAAGLSIALEWQNSPHRVVLLESGGLEYDDRVQDLLAGKTTGQPYYPLKSTRLSYFGGTTGHWGGFCSILDSIDFLERDWVPQSGWPITLDDLVPFYQRAHEYLDLGPYDYSPDHWQQRRVEFGLLPFQPGPVFNKLWRFSPPTRYGTKYRNTVMDSRNIALYTYATVVDIKVHSGLNAVQQLTVRNYTGKTHRVQARCFVLACSTIQNARLLLASNSQIPAGLGNQHDQVGRYFMEHVEIKSAELRLDRPRKVDFYLGNRLARVELAVTAASQREQRMLNCTASLTPLEVARKLKPVVETWSSEDPRESGRVLRENQKEARVGPLARLLASGLHQHFELYTRLEQAPNPDSRVTLDTERDGLGVPRARLHWELTPLEKHSLRSLYWLIGQQFGAAGLGRVRLMPYLQDPADETWPAFTSGGWHHIGATRMSDNPARGVVDSNCQVFGFANLFIAGASCFPTAGAVNPTLTLVALSLRLSDYLKGALSVTTA
jgi:choline dehydrogenase-like flavoprotein